MYGQGIESSRNPVTPGSLRTGHERLAIATSTSDCVPPWVEYLAGPVWVTDSEQKIRYVNSAALNLLRVEERDCLGKPCFEVIAAMDQQHEMFCSENCALRQELERKRRIKPARLELVSSDGERHRLHVVAIPAIPPWDALTGDSALVHCGIVDDRALAIEEYLERVTKRTPKHTNQPVPLNNFKLTRREREILELLTEDETLWSIAHKLHVSYTTVRNHVQHILTKLGVHSIIEAVAYYLVARKE